MIGTESIIDGIPRDYRLGGHPIYGPVDGKITGEGFGDTSHGGFDGWIDEDWGFGGTDDGISRLDTEPGFFADVLPDLTDFFFPSHLKGDDDNTNDLGQDDNVDGLWDRPKQGDKDTTIGDDDEMDNFGGGGDGVISIGALGNENFDGIWPTGGGGEFDGIPNGGESVIEGVETIIGGLPSDWCLDGWANGHGPVDPSIGDDDEAENLGGSTIIDTNPIPWSKGGTHEGSGWNIGALPTCGGYGLGDDLPLYAEPFSPDWPPGYIPWWLGGPIDPGPGIISPYNFGPVDFSIEGDWGLGGATGGGQAIEGFGDTIEGVGMGYRLGGSDFGPPDFNIEGSGEYGNMIGGGDPDGP